MTQIVTSSEEGGHASGKLLNINECIHSEIVLVVLSCDNQVEKSACVGHTVTSNTDLGHISGKLLDIVVHKHVLSVFRY
jgi:hypothetical protein